MKLFKFDKDDIMRHIEYELRTTEKFREPMNFVIKGLAKNTLAVKSLDKPGLDKVKQRKGKNYNWSVFTYENVTLVVRQYHQHLTVFTKVAKPSKKTILGIESKNEYGAFLLNTDMEKFGDKHDEMMDEYWEKPFTDLEAIFKNLIKVLQERGVYWVWNSSCLKTPKHVELRLAFDGDRINSVDDFIFCMEEVSSMYLELFAESVTVKRLKEIETGQVLNEYYKVGKITTEVKNDYYHAVGMELARGKEKSFNDVYSLTRYYFKEVFGDMLYFHDGEVYVKYAKGGKLVAGCPAAYKNDPKDRGVTIYQDSYHKYIKGVIVK